MKYFFDPLGTVEESPDHSRDAAPMPLEDLLERRFITGADGFYQRLIRRRDGRLKERLKEWLDSCGINVAGGFIHSIHLIQVGRGEPL